MKSPTTIGVDIGTTNAKVLLVDEAGEVIVEKFSEYPVHYPHPGWAEQDPNMWVKTASFLLNEVCNEIPADYELKAIGISGQMHGLIALDQDTNVLCPAILWNDQRSATQCESILQAVGGPEQLLDLTNNGLLPGYTFPKLVWLKEHEPSIYKKIVHVLLPKDYVRLKLSGHLGTDYSDASGTGCFDVENRRWATSLIEMMGVPSNWFPQPHLATEIVGAISGLPGQAQPVPVVAGSGDAVLQPLASGVSKLDEALLVVGTGGNVTVKADGFSRNLGGKVQFFCDAIDEQYVAMGVTLSAGESLRWLRNLLNYGLKVLDSTSEEVRFEDLIRLAEMSPECSNGVMFTPYLQGERCPHADPNVRASFTGLSSSSSLADLARAVLEGVAFSLKDVSMVLESIGLRIESYRLMGGGGKSELWNNIFANVLNKPVSTQHSSIGGTAFGSALLAKIGYSSESWVTEKQKVGDVSFCLPTPSVVKRYADRFDTYRSIYEETKPI